MPGIQDLRKASRINELASRLDPAIQIPGGDGIQGVQWTGDAAGVNGHQDRHLSATAVLARQDPAGQSAVTDPPGRSLPRHPEGGVPVLRSSLERQFGRIVASAVCAGGRFHPIGAVKRAPIRSETVFSAQTVFEAKKHPPDRFLECFFPKNSE